MVLTSRPSNTGIVPYTVVITPVRVITQRERQEGVSQREWFHIPVAHARITGLCRALHPTPPSHLLNKRTQGRKPPHAPSVEQVTTSVKKGVHSAPRCSCVSTRVKARSNVNTAGLYFTRTHPTHLCFNRAHVLDLIPPRPPLCDWIERNDGDHARSRAERPELVLPHLVEYVPLPTVAVSAQ